MPLAEFSERYPDLVEHLCRAARNERVAHAYLITGDNAASIEHFATAWLQVCVCSAPQPSGDACGECRECRQLAAEKYPVMEVVRPVSKSRQIRLEDIYQLEHFLHLTADGKIRIAKIVSAECMNIQTQNAFLKTLEEPTPKTMIVLLTTTPSQLLPTIRSRCQMIPLLDNRVCYRELPEVGRLFHALAGMVPDSGAAVASAAAGEIIGVMDALREAADADSKEYRQELSAANREADAAVRKQVEEEALAYLESQYRGRRAELLSAVHTWFAQEYMRACGVDVHLLPNHECYQHLESHLDSPPQDPESLRSVLRLTDALLDTLKYNVDEKLAIENYCQQVCRKISASRG